MTDTTAAPPLAAPTGWGPKGKVREPIAVIIFSGEVKDFFGLRMGAVPVPFLSKWTAFVGAAHTVNWSALGIAALALTIILLWPRVSRRVPGPFVALIVTTLVAWALHLPVETIGSRFGGIPRSLPSPGRRTG